MCGNFAQPLENLGPYESTAGSAQSIARGEAPWAGGDAGGLSHPKTCGTPKLRCPELLWFTRVWAGRAPFPPGLSSVLRAGLELPSPERCCGRRSPVPPGPPGRGCSAPASRGCWPWNQSQRRQIALSVPMIFNSVFPRAIRSIFSSSRWSFPILLSAVPAPRAVTSHHAFSQAICTSSFFCCHQFSGSLSPLLCPHRSFCGDETQPSEPQQKEMQGSPAAPAHSLFVQMGE